MVAAETAESVTGFTVEQAASQILGLMAQPAKPADTDASTPPASPSDDEEKEPEHSDEAETPPADDATTAPEEESEKPSTEPLYTVTVDGKPVQVTLKEALSDYSGRAHITRKLQEFSEKERAVQAKEQAIAEANAKAAEEWRVAHELAQSLQSPEPDWIKIRTEEGPDAFAARYAQWNLEQRQVEQIAAKRREAEEKAQADFHRTLQQKAVESEKALREMVPEWKDDKRYAAEAQEIRDYAFTKAGVQNEVQWMNVVANPEAVLLMRDALAYRRMMQKGTNPAVAQKIEQAKASAGQPTNGAPRPMQPGSNMGKNPVTEVTKAKQAHAKLKTQESAAQAILAHMAQRKRP